MYTLHDMDEFSYKNFKSKDKWTEKQREGDGPKTCSPQKPVIWKVYMLISIITCEIAFLQGSLKNRFGPWKGLEKVLERDFNFLYEPCPLSLLHQVSQTSQVVGCQVGFTPKVLCHGWCYWWYQCPLDLTFLYSQQRLRDLQTIRPWVGFIWSFLWSRICSAGDPFIAFHFAVSGFLFSLIILIFCISVFPVTLCSIPNFPIISTRLPSSWSNNSASTSSCNCSIISKHTIQCSDFQNTNV